MWPVQDTAQWHHLCRAVFQVSLPLYFLGLACKPVRWSIGQRRETVVVQARLAVRGGGCRVVFCATPPSLASRTLNALQLHNISEGCPASQLFLVRSAPPALFLPLRAPSRQPFKKP